MDIIFQGLSVTSPRLSLLFLHTEYNQANINLCSMHTNLMTITLIGHTYYTYLAYSTYYIDTKLSLLHNTFTTLLNLHGI